METQKISKLGEGAHPPPQTPPPARRSAPRHLPPQSLIPPQKRGTRLNTASRMTWVQRACPIVHLCQSAVLGIGQRRSLKNNPRRKHCLLHSFQAKCNDSQTDCSWSVLQSKDYTGGPKQGFKRLGQYPRKLKVILK